MTKPTLTVLDGTYSIHRLHPGATVPTSVFDTPVFWLGKTEDELSIVCEASIQLPAQTCEPDWSCLKVSGPLDFSATGIIAGISGVLASAGVGVFVISTFDTDYVLVKATHLTHAVDALSAHGYEVRRDA